MRCVQIILRLYVFIDVPNASASCVMISGQDEPGVQRWEFLQVHHMLVLQSWNKVLYVCLQHCAMEKVKGRRDMKKRKLVSRMYVHACTNVCSCEVFFCCQWELVSSLYRQTKVTWSLCSLFSILWFSLLWFTLSVWKPSDPLQFASNSTLKTANLKLYCPPYWYCEFPISIAISITSTHPQFSHSLKTILEETIASIINTHIANI